jgi:streptomycin 6-kinase
LPDVLAGVTAAHGLRLGAAFEPGGGAAYVAPAVTPAGGTLVVKVRWRHYEADDEAAGLRFWDGAGTVRLLDEIAVDETTDVLLLERCEPGTPAGSLPPAEQDELVAGLLRRLWRAAPPGRFRPLATMCGQWAAGLDRERATAALGDAGLVRAGVEAFVELGAAPDGILLATDLHAGNVLAARREPWLVIDPKPYVGDRTYDALQHLLNRGDELAVRPRRLVERMAGLLDLDPLRLAAWLFARCVVECDEQPELAAVARQLRP